MTTQLHSGLEHTRGGKIRTAAKSKSNTAIRLLLISLVVITAAALLTFDYKNIDLGKALADTLHNIRTVFLSPKLVHDSFGEVLESLLVTFCLGALATILGMVLAFFAALLCASNIANPKTAALIKGIVALVRAVPTVLWVLIFAVSAGLGSVAAVVGLTFHSFAYLTKVYAESIEEIDKGTIEALKASGASFSRQSTVLSACSTRVGIFNEGRQTPDLAGAVGIVVLAVSGLHQLSQRW